MSDRFDVIVAGAGAVGLSAGLAAACAGLRVCVVGRIDRREGGRTVALLDGSIRFLRALNAWEAIAPQSAPLEIMRIVDDTGSLFRTPPVDFRASEIGLSAFGSNVENVALVKTLAELARAAPGLTLLEDMIFAHEHAPDAIRVSVGDRTLEGALLVGADGRASPSRKAAGIGVRSWSYPQSALTTIFSHTLPHENVSTEFHTRAGPFTLVPLPGRAHEPHRSSLVWVTTPDEAQRLLALAPDDFAREAERQAHAVLGAMELAGPIGHSPISALKAKSVIGHRTVLVGDAAHALAPIGAQGLNLGLRDVAELARFLAGADDPGALGALRSYARARERDAALRTLGVDLLNRSLLAPFLPVDLARGLGLTALAHIGPLRRAFMRAGLAQRAAAPARSRSTAEQGPSERRRTARKPDLA